MDLQETMIIQAAGGLLWREADGQRLLAVVHRARYDDWTLPKGKHEVGEDLEATALREVTEETGCQPCLGSFAGTRSYPSRDGQKVVHFWHMICDGECAFTPSDEVDQLIWLHASEAVYRLTYADEAAFLKSAVHDNRDLPGVRTPPPDNTFVSTPSGWDRLMRRLPWRSTSHKRLARSVVAFRAEFNLLAARSSARTTPAGWQHTVYSLLDRVEEALQDNDTELGWRCFNAAQRQSMYALTPAERQSEAQVLVLEAVRKLRSWRKDSVERLLLDADGKLCSCINVQTLMQAMQIAQEHNENAYLKLYSIRSQLLLLSLIALLVTGYLFINPAPLAGLAADSPVLVRYVILFGVLGASISGILSLANSGAGERYLEQLLSSWIAFARVAVGAVAALVVYAFLSAGLINLEPGGLTAWAVLAFAFAAGFSERLLARAMGSISG